MPSMRRSSTLKAEERAIRQARATRSHEDRIVLSMFAVWVFGCEDAGRKRRKWACWVERARRCICRRTRSCFTWGVWIKWID